MDTLINLSIEDFSTTVAHPQGKIVIWADGTIEIVGPIKDAALALANHIIRNEYTQDLVSLEINKSLLIEFDKNFKLSCLLEKKPEFFDELVVEFQRIIKMKTFW